MYRTIEDFKKDWEYESKVTAKILGNLTDASLSQRGNAEGRTLGYLAWHIVICLGMAAEAGLPYQAAAEANSPPPSRAADIHHAYRTSAAELIASIERTWQDADLAEKVQMYGETWTRAYALYAMVKHQAHHRGQMTVLMRQAGLAVPGAYGPAREEWAAIGMEPQP
jgi:uncharacterized damage-inducible protein DinB